MTPPDTPLFPSLDDEAPRVIPAQRGRPRAQPISISRSSTMEKSHRSSKGSPSPNRSSPSPHSHEPTIQPRTRATSALSSSPPPTRSRRPITGSRRSSSPSSKPSSPPPRSSTPTSRRLSTGSSTTRGVSVNSSSSKVTAWQVNIPGFSTEAPPNLRTSLADRPASYVRGSSPASRNGRKSKSPVAPRSIASSHSKGSYASCDDDDDVGSQPSGTVDGLNSRRVNGFRINNYNKVPSPQKANRTVSSSSAPKRSFDVALRQMDHKKGPQNMFRPLLSSVPTTNLYAGKSTPAWNSSVTTSSNASSDLGTSGPHDIEENEPNEDEASSGITKVPDSNVNDEEIFMFEKTDSVNEDTRTETHHVSPNEDDLENLVQDNYFNGQDDMLICSRCGCEYSVVTQTEDGVKLCLNCQKSTSALTCSDTVKPQLTFVKDESPELTCKGESPSEQHEPTQLNHDEISQPKLSYIDTSGEQIQQTVDFPKSKDDSLQGEGISTILKRGEQIQQTVDFPKSKDESLEERISTILKRSNSMKGSVTRSRNFSASSISYDALSYMSASSSVDFGPRVQSQLSSRKSDTENYKYDPVNVKHCRSMSSLSGTSSHAFHPSSVGTSTLDSFVREERDVADSASVGPRENPSENDACTENVDSSEVLFPEVVTEPSEISVVRVERDVADLASVGPQEIPSENDTCTEEVEGPASHPEVEDLGNDSNALVTCTVEEGTNLDARVDSNDETEVPHGDLSEGEVDRTCSSSPASQSHFSQRSDSGVEEFQDPHVSAADSKDTEVSALDFNTSNNLSSIVEESMVLVEGQGGTKGRSLTLEEATDTILFCSSIVHNIAYEAANIAMEKETPSEPSSNNDHQPLVPAVPKSYSGRKYLQSRKTSRRSSKPQKTKRKTVEGDTMKAPNSINTGEEISKTRIDYSNNKENTKPPILEAKCNCRIM